MPADSIQPANAATSCARSNEPALADGSTKALVLGAGLSGLAAAKLLAALGANVSVADRKCHDDLGKVGEELRSDDIPVLTEDEALKIASKFDLIVASPGVSFNHPLAAFARKSGVKVVGELELGYRCCDVPVLGVTGTNGKTSVTSITGHVLSKLGIDAFVGGNIGSPFSGLALDLLNGGKRPDFAVLEISSFQLETVERFGALAAALLNLTPDHLDRHATLESYLEIKTRIFSRMDPKGRAVLNLGDEMVKEIMAPAPIHGFSTSARPARGAWAKNGIIEIVDGGEVLGEADFADFRLEGLHNQDNVMAAALLAGAAGADPQKALDAAKDFAPGDHRLETVGIFGGVKYIDDSKATNVGAVEAALKSVPGPVVLIMGGRDKDLDFGYLAPFVKGKVKKLVLLGECREKIAASLGGAAECVMADSMGDAVKISKESASAGDSVLLSPATASFDMFRDYKERGEVFQREARKLAREAGESDEINFRGEKADERKGGQS